MIEKFKCFLALGKNHFITVIIKGLFWLAPIIASTIIILWIYDKVDLLTGKMFLFFGFEPENFPFLWTVIGVVLLGVIAYMVGIFVETRLGEFIQKIYSKVPGYATIKELINIFNTSKSGEKKVLVVAINGFAKKSYNIGLMYSTKESIIKDHYTVTLSMTPIPNGGYMFEVHKDEIYVIEEATFDSNLQYLLSMGVKSMAEIIDVKPSKIKNLKTISQYLEEKNGEEK